MQHIVKTASYICFLLTVLCAADTGAVVYARQQTPPDSSDVRDEQERINERENTNRRVRRYSDMLRENPDNLEIRYLRAKAYHQLSKMLTLSELIAGVVRGPAAFDREKARQDFEYILARDSLYRDVLIQYALLQCDHRVYSDALKLASEQISLKPALATGHVGLFHVFKHCFNYAGADETATYVTNDSTPYARFFELDILRRTGNLDRARRALDSLLADNHTFSSQPILLSLARLNAAKEDMENTNAVVQQAIDSIRTSVDASFIFEDTKYIMSDDELARYRVLRTADDYRAFFRVLWARRNPLPASEANVRIFEHYRRLLVAEEEYVYFGFRTWHNNPDRFQTIRFPEAYHLNKEFNDKGLVYIRHGEPADRVRTAGLNIETNESWRYVDPDMDFHFGMVAGGNNWRIVPTLQLHPDVLESREIWGGTYHIMARALRDRLRGGARASMAATDLVVGESILIDESRENIRLGLTTDRFFWDNDYEPLDIPSLFAAFRGEQRQTQLELYYAIPVGYLSVQQDEPTFPFELGMAVYDTSWQIVDRIQESKRLPNTPDVTAAAVDYFRVIAPPDSYHVSFYGRMVESNLMGGYNSDIRIPDFSGPGLQMSDLLPAYDMYTTQSPGHYTKGDFYLSINPTGRFNTQRPLFLYFEIYGLTFDAADLTRYAIEYTLIPENRRRRVLGLFGRRDNRPSLSLKTTSQGREGAPVEHAEIDVSSVDPGMYTLKVTLTDENLGTAVSRTTSVELL